jgi:hypothetical protein
LEAYIRKFGKPLHDFLEEQLEATISHTRHLSIRGDLESLLRRLVSSAPILELLSLSHEYFMLELEQAVIPIDLFNYTAPCLTSLELSNCDFSWKSPLLKGLRTLKIRWPSIMARPKLKDWLHALKEMAQLATLILQSATPLASLATPLLSEPSRTVTLSSLTRLDISASAKDCALALAHLVLPALTWLRVDAESHEREGEDVRLVFPHISRNISGLQDAEPLRSILVSGERTRAEVLAWSTPNTDVKVYGPATFVSASVSARLMFAATGKDWLEGVDTVIFDALLTLLPVNSVSTLSAQNLTRLSKEFWLSHVPRWPLLEQARLVPTAVKAFRDMLAEDAPPDGPRLPSLTKLILVHVTLTTDRAHHLRDMLIGRVEQGVPMEVLDLRTCVAADRAVQLLTEIVVDVQEPPAAGPTTMEEASFFHPHGGIWHCNAVEYDDGEDPWYGTDEEDESDLDGDDYDDYHHDYHHDSDYDDDYDSDYEYNSEY